ncbi:ubinuclein-1-like [Salvia splendens]|uniref:ubinuclein-1-like n=1 Tax=Salvia splendens TaxID=180675 RepID=UPI001C25CE7E|nr:ubinuclein-1-like [Salvia splendens]
MVKGAESVQPKNGPESKQGASVEVGGGRVRINVELNPWKTTIVSWKKILKRANLSEANGPGPSAPGPSFEARGDDTPNPLAAASQMNETGNRDEEDLVIDIMPNDDDYDTDNSFIEDTELEQPPNITNLENAFGELEKIVKQFRPPPTDPQDPANQFQSCKKRLPTEIKLELAKVARIAGSCYRRIPKDVISRLMSILGHLMKITTLKKYVEVECYVLAETNPKC